MFPSCFPLFLCSWITEWSLCSGLFPRGRCCSCVLGIIDAIAFAYIRCREFWALLLYHWSLNGRCVWRWGMGLLSVPASAPPMAADLYLVSNVGLVQEKVISSFLSDSQALSCFGEAFKDCFSCLSCKGRGFGVCTSPEALGCQGFLPCPWEHEGGVSQPFPRCRWVLL